MAHLLFYAAISGALATSRPIDDVESAFEKYKIDFQRNYVADSQEHSVRFKHFKKAYAQVHQFETAPVIGGDFAFDEYSDATDEEFAQQRLGYTDENTTQRLFLGHSLSSWSDSEAIAASIDWVALNAVGPVHDQGQCGSCWAFTTTGVLEGAIAVSTHKLVDISEEQFLACQGGNLDRAMLWAKQQGLCTEQNYPYKNGLQQGCQTQQCNNIPAGCVTGVYRARSNEEAFISALSEQPVAVGIYGTDLQGYIGGSVPLRRRQPCDGTFQCALNHGVLVVGFDAKSFTIKNSWGTKWGNSGYAFIARASDPEVPYQGPYGAFAMYKDPVFAIVSPFCAVNSQGVSDKEDLWKRISTSPIFWPSVAAGFFLSCVAVLTYLWSRGRKARQLRTSGQGEACGSGVSMLGF